MNERTDKRDERAYRAVVAYELSKAAVEAIATAGRRGWWS